MSWLCIFSWLDKDASIEDRLVLVRVVSKYSSMPSFRGRVRELASRLKLPEKMVALALPGLVRSGALEAMENAGPIGRPSYDYRVGDKVKAAAKEGGESKKISHFSVIESLALDVPSVSITKKADRLSPLNAFTLAFLMFHGGASGVVCRLSKDRYRRFLGLTGDRLDSQIKKLERLGYILGRRPGAYSPRFLGVVPSTLFLDLEKCYGATSVTFDMTVSSGVFKYEEHVAGVVFGLAGEGKYRRWEFNPESAGKLMIPTFKLPPGAKHYFLDQNRAEVQLAFQVLLDVCACELLVDVENGKPEDADQLSDRYAARFMPSLSAQGHRLTSVEQWLRDFVYDNVRKRMQELKLWLDAIQKSRSKGKLVGLAMPQQPNLNIAPK
ncbi:hypothetical protein [Marinimicrobium koreense]|uniref:hypothetical protein n=1 Tax=Marinimicrobium koreense TaxID=306545 RepID=UPI003F6F2059